MVNNKIMIKNFIQSVKQEPIDFIINLAFLTILTEVLYFLIWIFY